MFGRKLAFRNNWAFRSTLGDRTLEKVLHKLELVSHSMLVVVNTVACRSMLGAVNTALNRALLAFHSNLVAVNKLVVACRSMLAVERILALACRSKLEQVNMLEPVNTLEPVASSKRHRSHFLVGHFQPIRPLKLKLWYCRTILLEIVLDP